MFFYHVQVKQKPGANDPINRRIGSLKEPDNVNFPAITIQSPAEFKGPFGSDGKSLYWTPEDLFVASVAVCFFTTFVTISENSNFDYETITIDAMGKMEEIPEVGKHFTEIILKPEVKIKDDKRKKKAVRILELAEKRCLIGNSIKTKVILEPKIVIG